MQKKNDLVSIIEAALFMSSRSMDLAELAVIIARSKPQTKKIVDELATTLAERSSGLRILDHEGGFRLSVRDDVIDSVAHLAEKVEITEAETRTLAVIVHYEPLLQSELVRMRGNNAYNHIATLKEKGYVDGRPHGRSQMLSTTDRFLSHFAVSGEEFGRLALRQHPAGTD